jgi:hypothetical protein
LGKTIKEHLTDQCRAQLQARIATLQRSVETIQAARNNETKSSAGDKYETGRAMMQMEEDKVMAQLDQAQFQLQQLRQIPAYSGTTISSGSLVRTQKGCYFLSVSMGKAIVDGTVFYCISTQAPLAQQMLGKSKGDRIAFNGQEDEILEVT